SPNCHADREILPFHVARRNVARVWTTIANLDYGFHHRRRRVTSSGIALPVIAVYFYDLREVGLTCEHILDTALVEMKPVSRKLEAIFFGQSVTSPGTAAASAAVRSPAVCAAHGVPPTGCEYPVGITVLTQ